jgi:hypothetical protein
MRRACDWASTKTWWKRFWLEELTGGAEAVIAGEAGLHLGKNGVD